MQVSLTLDERPMAKWDVTVYQSNGLVLKARDNWTCQFDGFVEYVIGSVMQAMGRRAGDRNIPPRKFPLEGSTPDVSPPEQSVQLLG